MSAGPSRQHRLVADVVLPLMGIRRKNTPARLARSLAAAAREPEPELPAAAREGLTVTRSTRPGWPVLTFTPAAGGATGGAVLCLHGGAYVYDATPGHLRYYADLARATGAEAVVPLYPTAPRGTAAEVVPSVADVVGELVERHGPAGVTVLGDSAGGGLALAALQVHASRGGPPPARLALVSPWLDVTVPDPRSIAVRDPMLHLQGLRECGRMWAGALDPADPLVSPLYGSLDGLPPVHVWAGTRDLLFPDSVRLAERAAAEGVQVSLDLRPGLIHCWPVLVRIPEGATATEELRTLLRPAPGGSSATSPGR